jgi:NADH:ubiquinone oxidoreductase subunit C
MFGIRPVFNSSLNKILTDYSFIGHPLRRDFFSPLVFDVDFTEWGELSKVGRLFKKQIYEVGL